MLGFYDSIERIKHIIPEVTLLEQNKKENFDFISLVIYLGNNLTDSGYLPERVQKRDFNFTFNKYENVEIKILADKLELVKFMVEYKFHPEEARIIIEFVVKEYYNNDYGELKAGALTMMLHIGNLLHKGDIIINDFQLYWRESIWFETFLKELR